MGYRRLPLDSTPSRSEWYYPPILGVNRQEAVPHYFRNRRRILPVLSADCKSFRVWAQRVVEAGLFCIGALQPFRQYGKRTVAHPHEPDTAIPFGVSPCDFPASLDRDGTTGQATSQLHDIVTFDGFRNPNA